VGKDQELQMIDLVDRLYRKVGSEPLKLTYKLTTAKALKQTKSQITDANDAYSKWYMSPEGKLWRAWEEGGETGDPPNGGPTAAGVNKPKQWIRQEETSLSHRITAANEEEQKCVKVTDYLVMGLDKSWDPQTRAIADNKDHLSVFEQLRALLTTMTRLGLGIASLVSGKACQEVASSSSWEKSCRVRFAGGRNRSNSPSHADSL
jgi:hypothetical protein